MGVRGSQENSEKKPVVLIIGGGYGGIQCAKLLDKTGQFFVILIDRKSYFFHNVGALRAAVEPDFAQKILVPYDRLLANGCVIQAEVVSISTDSVRIHGRDEVIHFDYLIIATGSSYAFPGKVAESEVGKAIDLYQNLRKKIDIAQQILIIGGGPVGIELAGEIAQDFPDKEVTLVHSRNTLLEPNVYQEKLYRRTQDELERLRVKIILNDRVEVPNHEHLNYIEGKKTYVTVKNKTKIDADLTFFCMGTRINNKSLLNSPFESHINPQTGRIRVNNYFQIEGQENIFAIGDICDKEAKFAYLAGEQGEYVANLIHLIHRKKPYPKEYQVHVKPIIVVSIGRDGGVGQLRTKGGIVISGYLVKHLKSKDMFAGRFRSVMNYKSNNQVENKEAYSDRLETVQSILSFSEQDARNLLAGLPVKELEPGQDFI